LVLQASPRIQYTPRSTDDLGDFFQQSMFFGNGHPYLRPELHWEPGTNIPAGISHQSCADPTVSHHVIADLPSGRYTAGFAFAECLPEGRRELAWHDVLCEFNVSYPENATYQGYSHLPIQISFYPTQLAIEQNVINQPIGEMSVINPVESMVIGSLIDIDVQVINRSEQVWVGDIFRPVNLAYHWLKESGEVFIFEGLRTPLPVGGVGAHKTLNTRMSVAAPNEDGQYILMLSMLQENVGWFEHHGFKTAQLNVEVTRVA
jgi:hypothetical protein